MPVKRERKCVWERENKRKKKTLQSSAGSDLKLTLSAVSQGKLKYGL
jgi:hypothetical protein